MRCLEKQKSFAYPRIVPEATLELPDPTETVLKTLPGIESVSPVETNIIIFKLAEGIDEAKFISKLDAKNIKISSLGKGKLRIVTHLDYTNPMHDYFLSTLKTLKF